MTRGLRSNIKIDVPLTSTSKLCTHEISHVFTRNWRIEPYQIKNKIETKSNFINQVYFYISCIYIFLKLKYQKQTRTEPKSISISIWNIIYKSKILNKLSFTVTNIINLLFINWTIQNELYEYHFPKLFKII